MIQIQDKTKCCGCEACVNVCTHKAITMQEDERGFLYPTVDESLCTNCRLCNSVCAFGSDKPVTNTERQDVYAVKNKNIIQLKESTSGGAFSALAQWILNKGGTVYGSAWNENMMPIHIRIQKVDDLPKLQGSKYVQSQIGGCLPLVKADLREGKQVLFSGTPCQCAGLRAYLKQDYENLVCVELICHGVPSARFLRNYLDVLEDKVRGKIIDLKFRDKKRGWGALLHATYKKTSGTIKHIYLSIGESYYYYYYYWGGNLYRPSCYNCKYATSQRASDFTIGDYWGVKNAHPDFDTKLGVSVLLANTIKAHDIIKQLSNYLDIIPSSIELAQRENGQLVSASHHNTGLDKLWNIYEKEGAKGLDKYYSRTHRKTIFKSKLKRKIPLWLKLIIKHIR